MTDIVELAIVPKETALQVFTTEKGLDPYLEQIREVLDAFEPDVSTKKGRDAIASIAFKVAKAKTAIDGVGKDLVADLKDLPKKVDAERKRARDTLDVWRDNIRAPLTSWEQAEDARVQRHKDAIEGIVTLVTNSGETADSLRAAIDAVECIQVGPHWEEFEPEAEHTKAKALTNLGELLAKREQYEADQAELVRRRAEDAQREQKAREERIAREAAEAAQREAETRARAEREDAIRREQEAKSAAVKRELELKLAAATAERERVEAVARADKAKQDADERERRAAAAERQRIADEQAALDAEVKRREADKAHKARVNRAALDAFIAGGMPAECAKQAVTMIAKGQIPAIKISY